MVLSNAQWFANPGVVYEIDESCRFNDDDSARLTQTFSSAPDSQKRFTCVFWLKRGGMDYQSISGAGVGATTGSIHMAINATGSLIFEVYHGSGWNSLGSTALYRDPSGWYQFMFVYDVDNATSGDRLRMWVNGTRVTNFATETQPTSSIDHLCFSNTTEMEIGDDGDGAYFDGYLAQFVGLDGIAASDMSDFGEINSTTGQWVPKDVSGVTLGTNGFILDFADSSDLGNNAASTDGTNDWTPVNLAEADQVVDTPTDNHCTLNVLRPPNTNLTFTEGNLNAVSSSGFHTYQATFALPVDGKWYWEVSAIGGSAPIGPGAGWDGMVGINRVGVGESLSPEAYNWGWGNAQTTASGKKYNDGQTNLVPASSLTDNSIVMIAVDMPGGKIWWGVDGSWMGTDSGDNDGDPAAGSNPAFDNVNTDEPLFPGGGCENDPHRYNFGQLGFAHTPPTGFKGLSTANLDDPTIADPSGSFQSTIYTGDGESSLAVNQDGNSTFEPDFVWIKNRDATDNHCLFDTARGATELLSSNTTDTETTDADTLTAFDSDGFTVGADVKVNTNTEKYVGWQWLESATPGFDIVLDTGTGSAHTISHSLGVTPEFFIRKERAADVGNWHVYHKDMNATPEDYYMALQATAAAADDAGIWNDTAPTSSVFTVGSNAGINGSTDTYVTYLWAGVEGFSKFGSYVGNGSTDGPFVWCGLSPSFVMTKRTNAAGDWKMWDNKRIPYNVITTSLAANVDAADNTGAAQYIDFLSNGFKIKGTDTETNGDGSTYIFAAFASTPFKTATAR